MTGLAERVLHIIRGRYSDFGPTLACEKLAKVHGLYLAKETNDTGRFTDPPVSRDRRVYISHARVGPAPENSFRLMVVSIAGSRIVVRRAYCSFMLMMQRAS